MTGGFGLVGSFVIRRLLTEGFYVKTLRRSESDTRCLSDVLEQIEIIRGDILDVVLLEDIIKDVDYVVHTAGIVSYDPADREEIFKINVEGTSNLVNAALSFPVKKFCHVSSVATLGRGQGEKVVVDEETPRSDVHEQVYYAQSKYLSEKEVWRGVCEGLPAVIVNPSVILGPGDIRKSSTRLFGHILRKKNYYPSGKFNYIDVRDLADIIFRMLISDVSGERFIAGAGAVSYKEFFRKTAKHLNGKIPKFEINYSLARFIEKVDKLRTFLFGGSRVVTKESIETLRSNTNYDNTKIKQFFGVEFRNLDDTVSWACSYLQERIL